MVPLYEQYGSYHRALQTVLDGMKEYTGNLLQRDGILQRFEYTIELLRKTVKRILEFQQVIFSPTPNDSLREGCYAGIISDPELALKMVKMRNLLSHVYDDDDIQDIWIFLSTNKKFFVQKDKEIKTYLDNLHAKLYHD